MDDSGCRPQSGAMTEADRQSIIAAIARADFDTAAAACLGFLSRDDSAEAVYLLAAVRSAQGDHATALQLFEGAAQLLPERVDLAYNYGVALRQAKRLPEAMAQWRRCVQLQPDHVDGWRNLGRALYDAQDHQGAFDAFSRLLELVPDDRDALELELGNLRFRMFDYDGAAAFYCKAINRNPEWVKAWTNLGQAMRATEYYESAEICLRQAMTLQPDFPQAHFNLACLLLEMGRWREGFAEYEWRSTLANRPAALAALPEWNGTEPPGCRVALWNDQGFGDAIHFLRYASAVLARGHIPTLVIGRDLFRLAGTAPWLAGVCDLHGPLPAFDAQISLASLPHRLGVDGPEGSWPGPYLAAAPIPLPRRQRRAVALVWAGAGGYAKDEVRSVPVAALQPLLAVPGIDWFSLQMGERAGEVAGTGWEGVIEPLGARLGDFADTAAIIAGMDLVITVDTSVAHLAGAMGKPVWVMLRKSGDWRWQAQGDTTSWYPSMRLFRQTAPGDWGAMVATLADALAREMAES